MTDEANETSGAPIPDISDDDPWGQQAYVAASETGGPLPTAPDLRARPVFDEPAGAATTTATIAAGDGHRGGGPPGGTGGGPGEQPPPARKGTSQVWEVVGWVGRSLITVGLLILLFVSYQLWGTGIIEARAQDDLQGQFKQSVEKSGTSSTTTAPEDPTVSTTTAVPVPVPTPPTGEAVAHLVIPKVGIDDYVVQGVGRPDLRKGPGHYPETPMPGQVGNAAIAGHRTTYGAPFNRLDELEAGDKIEVTVLTGASYQYTVTEKLIVKPTETDVLLPTANPAFNPNFAEGPSNYKDLATITLTTCNPEYSAAQRLVIKASLDQPKADAAPVAPPAKQTTVKKLTVDTGTQGAESIWPTVIWGLIVAAVGALWFFAFRRWRHWYTWVIGAVPFLIVLFFLYAHIEQLLPTNY